MNPPTELLPKLLFILAVLGGIFVCNNLRAGSATWSSNPISGDWYTAENWIPNTVPNGPDDVATFDDSAPIMAVTFPTGSTTVLDSLILQSTPVYSITVGDKSSLTFVGMGALSLKNFFNHLSAAAGGAITFTGSSALEVGANVSGTVFFEDDSKATSDVDVDPDGVVIFSDRSGARGVVGVVSGSAYFNDDSTADQALFAVFGDGFADISGHHPPGLAVRIIDGDGTIFLGANNLTVIRQLSHFPFSGTLTDGGGSGGTGGSLIKAGASDTRLTLDGSSTYTGGTTVIGGALFIDTDSLSTPTGTGDVHVNNGVFGGKGNVQGNVVVGTGAGTQASLIPGKHGGEFGPLSIRRTLTFASDGILAVNINSKNSRNGKVSARGVTIASGAQIQLSDRYDLKIATDTMLTLINKTASTPISGTFANLPDGGTITVGANTYQANYEGGDGNDLTLTVLN